LPPTLDAVAPELARGVATFVTAAIEEFGRIVTAIEEGDAKAAERLSKEHVLNAGQSALSILEQSSATPTP
jgi:DNA-binding GntR family transcriptional regulator